MTISGYPAAQCRVCGAFYLTIAGHSTFDLCVPCNEFYDEWRHHVFTDLDGGRAFEEANKEKVEAMREWMDRRSK